MTNLSRFTTVAELDSAAVMVQELRSETVYRQTVLSRQVVNSEQTADSFSDDLIKAENAVAGAQSLVNRNASDPVALANWQAQLAIAQRELQMLQNREETYGPEAQQSKLEQIEMLNCRLQAIDTVLADIATKRNSLAA